MNKVKEIYCRIYQTTLRTALPFLPYRNPKILHSVTEIPGVLIEKGLKRPLLVTDRSIRELGLTKQRYWRRVGSRPLSMTGQSRIPPRRW